MEEEGFGDSSPLEGGSPDPNGGLTKHSFTRFYIGLGMYVTSIIFGTWKTSWGVEISGFESLQMSFNHVEEWPWEFANQVSLNQELMGWSFWSSLIGTTNWMFWDCFSIVVLASVVATLCFLISFKPFSTWILFALANSSQAIITACFFALFTQVIRKNGRGKIFGLWSAGLALAAACGPFISSLVVRFNINLPYLIAACITMASGLFYIYLYRKFGQKVN